MDLANMFTAGSKYAYPYATSPERTQDTSRQVIYYVESARQTADNLASFLVRPNLDRSHYLGNCFKNYDLLLQLFVLKHDLAPAQE